jgi:hypothetical protein
MIEASEIVIGNRGANFVAIRVAQRGYEGWTGAEIEVHCDGWIGKMSGCFMKGELARFAKEVRRLHRDLRGTAELQPLEPKIVLTFTGDGKGHVTVDGVARNDFASGTALKFQFTIDQTYLSGIADSLSGVDPE